MVKRKKRGIQAGVWQGAAATVGTLLFLIGALALAVQKGAVSAEAIRTGLIIACMAAGTAGLIMLPKGEGRRKLRLLVSGSVAAALLILSQLLSGAEGDRLRGALHGLCLFLPCLISFAADRKLRGRGAGGRTAKRPSAIRH